MESFVSDSVKGIIKKAFKAKLSLQALIMAIPVFDQNNCFNIFLLILYD